MIAYKLVNQRKNGTLGPLFINRKQIFPLGWWLRAESIPTKGFSYRPGFHCCERPHAPHLSTKGRVWVKVNIASYTEHIRPDSQGGKWFTANQMIILEILSPEQITQYFLEN